MATTSNNNIVLRGSVLGMAILTNGTADINQGDQVYVDTSAHVVKSLGVSDDTNAATFLGVAMDASYINPYGTKMYSPQIPVMTSGVVSFKTTAGDTYNAGDALYVGADAQTVTNTAGALTKKIGFVVTRPGQSAVAGGTGVTIDAVIEHQFPTAGI
jgi:hypothetical protein